jgi:hypothetical protein
MSMDRHDGMISTRKTHDLSTRAFGSSTNSHLVAKQEEHGKGNAAFCRRSFSFHTPQGYFTCRKFYDMGPTALLTLRRKACCGFLSPLKIHLPRQGLSPRTLGPMANMLTVIPSRTTVTTLNECMEMKGTHVT